MWEEERGTLPLLLSHGQRRWQGTDEAGTMAWLTWARGHLNLCFPVKKLSAWCPGSFSEGHEALA